MDKRSVDCPSALAGAALLSAALIAADTNAITINVDYDPTQPGAVDPAFDLFGAQLSPVVNYAAGFYEDAFEDLDHTITLTFWYTDLPDNQLGNHDNLSDDANGRELTGTLRFDLQDTSGTARSYFYDTTPGDDVEYNMGQAFWEDLTAGNQADFYNAGGSVPDTFEVGYFGTATGGPAASRIDMLTLVMHEMGHALGMSGGIPATVAETMDGDYDFDPAWVFGAALATDNIDQASDFVGHIDDPNNLMFPNLRLPGGGTTTGIRKRPSHADLFSMASGHDYDFIDVPRREFYGGTNFNLDANWSGDNNPEFNDEAFVRTGGDVFLFAGANVGPLHIERGTDLFTANSNLTVNGRLAVESTATGATSRLVINESTTATADDVLVGVHSAIELDGANLTAGGIQLAFDSVTPGEIRGHGTVQANTSLVNDGAIRPDGGTLSLFTVSASPVWDLDGQGTAGVIDAIAGNLFVSGALTDAFDGELTVGPPRSVTFNNGFQLGAAGNATVNGTLAVNFGDLQIDGTLTLANLGLIIPAINAGGATVGAGGRLATTGDTLVNAALTVAGELITGLGAADLNEPANIQSSAAVTVGLGGLIRFNDDTTLGGGDFAGLGAAHFHASVNVSGDTVIDLIGVDLDGESGVTSWTLTRDLTLNVDHIDTANETFNGTLNLNGLFPTLAVNLSDPLGAWTMAGTMNLEGNGMFFGATQVAGSIMRVTGDLNVDGLTRISATTFLEGDLLFEDADAILQLLPSARRHAITAGASVAGPGTLVIAAGASLEIADGVTIGSNLENHGTLSLGSSPGDVEVMLHFEQAADGTLVLEIGGGPRSGLFDTLDVSGTMTLDGLLSVALIDGFMPSIGNAFDLLDWGRLDGAFAQLDLPALASGSWDTSDLYVEGVIRVVPEPAAASLWVMGAWCVLFRRGSAAGKAEAPVRDRGFTGRRR